MSCKTRCKACGKLVDNAKERRILSGKVYSVLFEVAFESVPPPLTSAELHSFLSAGKTYVCKPCHATLLKYSSIKEDIGAIKHCMQKELQSITRTQVSFFAS